MARPKKSDDKPVDSASLQVSIEDFVRTRDSVSWLLIPSSHFRLCCRDHSTSPTRQQSRHGHQSISDSILPEHLIIALINKSSQMAQQHLTRDQRAQALHSMSLLTFPYQNVLELAFQLARNVVLGAREHGHDELIYTPKVVTGLATLQSAVQDLSRAYIAHTNTVIGKTPGSSLELLNLAGPLGGENVIFGNRAATPAPNVEGGENKKRKRAPHDKNAPKRPVTPYFLYMKTARGEIAKEMTPGHSAKEVADEGTKRWLTMPPKEKQVSRD